MTISGTEPLQSTAGNPGAAAQKVTAVVGFDGSEPSQRALAAAARLVAGRGGTVEVVYVAHTTTTESMSGLVAADLQTTFEELADELKLQAEQLLGHDEGWTFHRGEGEIAPALIAEADAQAEGDQHAQVVIVVGLPEHRYHQVIGSVPTGLAHHSHVPVLLVP
jgi:nucleotide-binding universal stress UspA family protein